MKGDALTLQPELGCNSPETVEDEYLLIVRDAIANTPRNLQKLIGPSGVGHPCSRHLLHLLSGERAGADEAWLPTIGTAMHTWLADTFTAYPHERYLVEQRVMVGHIAGQPIEGNSDLFDSLSGTVIDHKLVGETTIRKARRHGPSPMYVAQAHCYGRGFVNAGYHVNRVMIAYLPRNNISLNARYFWSEPYDESKATAALDRCTALKNLLDAVGLEQASSLYEPCGGTDFCKVCPPITPASRKADPNDPFGKR